jgi:hypothetical protein
MLSELESISARASWHRGGAGSAIVRRYAVHLALAGVAGLSIALRVAFGSGVHGPFVFMDELGYERMAQSFAHGGQLGLFGKGGLAYSPLYPLVLSPIYALTDSAHVAYTWVKVANAVLISLAIFPVYGIARSVLSRPRAVGVAALSAAAPLMFYSSLVLSENLAYPLTLLAIWAMLRAVREPRPRNDALLLAAIALAAASRLQEVALLPAAITAVLLVALVRRRRPQGHRLLFGSVGALAAVVLARTVANGGSLPLAGRYANVGHARANPLRVVAIAVQNLAGFDFALGVIPFAGALLAAYALARSGFPRRALAFGCVAASVAFWFLLEVAFDAAAFDRRTAPGHAAQLTANLPTIHERYLIYVVPLFLIALVAVLRARVPARAQLAAAATAALLPLAIPFGRVVNTTLVADSFGLQMFGRVVNGAVAPIASPRIVAIAVAGTLGLSYLYAVLRPRPSFAIVMTVLAFLVLSSLARVRLIGTANGLSAAQPAQHDWVDRAVGGADVALVGGRGATRIALLNTAANNLSISRLYTTSCELAFGRDFGERPLTGPVAARYAVVPHGLRVPGRRIASAPKQGLVLIAPRGGVLTVSPTKLRGLDCASA